MSEAAREVTREKDVRISRARALVGLEGAIRARDDALVGLLADVSAIRAADRRRDGDVQSKLIPVIRALILQQLRRRSRKFCVV